MYINNKYAANVVKRRDSFVVIIMVEIWHFDNVVVSDALSNLCGK